VLGRQICCQPIHTLPPPPPPRPPAFLAPSVLVPLWLERIPLVADAFACLPAVKDARTQDNNSLTILADGGVSLTVSYYRQQRVEATTASFFLAFCCVLFRWGDSEQLLLSTDICLLKLILSGKIVLLPAKKKKPRKPGGAKNGAGGVICYTAHTQVAHRNNEQNSTTYQHHAQDQVQWSRRS
jgi:hypothetical protein